MGRPRDHPWWKTGSPKSFLGCLNYFDLSLKDICFPVINMINTKLACFPFNHVATYRDLGRPSGDFGGHVVARPCNGSHLSTPEDCLSTALPSCFVDLICFGGGNVEYTRQPRSEGESGRAATSFLLLNSTSKQKVPFITCGIILYLYCGNKLYTVATQLGYVPALIYDSRRICNQGTTLRAQTQLAEVLGPMSIR